MIARALLLFFFFTVFAVAQPNDCVIVAVEKAHAIEAAGRLARADVWSRILIVHFAGNDVGHAFCVFQLQPTKPVCAYDARNGTLTLLTRSREPHAIARVIGYQTKAAIVSGRFLN
jgi:hypothetical protein